MAICWTSKSCVDLLVCCCALKHVTRRELMRRDKIIQSECKVEEEQYIYGFLLRLSESPSVLFLCFLSVITKWLSVVAHHHYSKAGMSLKMAHFPVTCDVCSQFSSYLLKQMTEIMMFGVQTPRSISSRQFVMQYTVWTIQGMVPIPNTYTFF